MARRKHTLGKIRAGRYNYRAHCIERVRHGKAAHWVRRTEDGGIFDMTRTLRLMCRRVDNEEREAMRRARDSFHGYQGA